MSKDPRDRYESAEAMAADLRRLHRGQRIRRRRTSKWRILVRQSWYHRRAIAVWGLGIFIVFAGATIGVEHYNSKAKEVEERDRRILEQDAKLKEEMERQQANWVEVWSCPDMEWIQNQVWTSDKTEPISVPRPNGVKGWQIMTGQRSPSNPQDSQGKKIPLRIDSGIHIRAQITPLTSESGDVEFFFHNKSHLERLGFGVGYGVILSLGTKTSKANVQIVKWTDNRADNRKYETMAQEFLPETPASFFLRILRDGAKIQVFLNDTMIPEFVDLEPFEGYEYANTYVVFNPLTVKIQDLTITRQRPSELVNRIALADSARLQEQYDYAIALYDSYLNDFPTTAQTTQATYGLALAKLGNAGVLSRSRKLEDQKTAVLQLQEALGLLRRIVDDPTGTERYRLAALFRAWSTSIRLGRMEDADKFFVKFQEIPDLDKLLKVTPLGLLEDLPNHYAQEGNRLKYQSIESALQLYQKAIDLAKYLTRDKRLERLEGRNLVPYYTSMHDLLWKTRQYDQALEVLQNAEKTIGPNIGPNIDLIVAQAETCMMQNQSGSSSAAAITWHRVLTAIDPKTLQANDPKHAYAERARIWLGQILLENGNIAGAQRIWNGQSNAINGTEEKDNKTPRAGVTHTTNFLAQRKEFAFDRKYLSDNKVPLPLCADLLYLRILRILEPRPLRWETIDQCLMLIDEALDLPSSDPADKSTYSTNFPNPLLIDLRDCLEQEVRTPSSGTGPIIRPGRRD
jgi:tetratricopeptide (TPR) repeat protein